MSYQVLARKWRPQQFKDVLGQEHISRTLQNAISRERIGHAYLFVGPRGIGKTTSARIFAKALNCENPIRDPAGTWEPCCECNTCHEIAAGNCLDVIEIDGASHNKVEDIRDICDNVQYAPTNGRKYKIYIIDEVHMLTTQAWNALLKTLEEPPEHVKFIFATTEAHKVLPTILSRTQRFDLKRLSVATIVERLEEIAKQEKVFISNDALTLIARAAEGGMRDAQSIFDQMLAFCGGLSETESISASDVVDVFGMTSQHELLRIQEAMLTNNPGLLVEVLHHLADNGRDLEKLFADVMMHLRNIMIFKASSNPAQILELSSSEAEDLQRLANIGDLSIIQRLVEGLLQYGDQIRHTLNKRVFLEITLLKVMQDAHAVRVDDLLTQLRAIQKGGQLENLGQVQVQTKTTVTTQESTIVNEPAPSLETPAPTEVPEPKSKVEHVAVAEPTPVIPTAPVVPNLEVTVPVEDSSIEEIQAEEVEQVLRESNVEVTVPSTEQPTIEATTTKAEAATGNIEGNNKTQLLRDTEDHQFVKEVKDLFNGELIDVKDRDQAKSTE